MSLLERMRRLLPGGVGADGDADIRHLRRWAATHAGVEAYVEPRTSVIPATMLLVAGDGAWTRRRISGPAQARRLGRELRVPVYDAMLVGYPKRMRERGTRRPGDPDVDRD